MTLRLTQYRVPMPYSVLDRSFDSDAPKYVRRITGEIRSTGRFMSGIDVEPNFDNDLNRLPTVYSWSNLRERQRYSRAAEREQERWEAAERAARIKRFAEMDEEWERSAPSFRPKFQIRGP